MEHPCGRILIVDDEVEIREVIKEALECQGYHCHTAPCGDAALEVLTHEPVDLALIDIIMPGMSGPSLFQLIKALHPDVAVVFVTAIHGLSTAVEQLKGGAYDYIVKPFSLASLYQQVESALERRAARLNEMEYRRDLEGRVADRAKNVGAMVRQLSSMERPNQAGEPARDSRPVLNMMSMQVAEKKRVSEYLHGHVQSMLLVLQRRLGQCQEFLSAQPEMASCLLEEIGSELRRVSEEDIRRVSHELYPSVVKLGLIPALRSLRDHLWGAVQVELRIEKSLTLGEQPLDRSCPEEFKVAVYCIVEEAMDNVVKHANVQSASVGLYYGGDGNISLDVTDDGHGFESDKVSSVSGLLAIHDYAEALGGTCEIDSEPGRGTRIHVSLPVPRRAQAVPSLVMAG